MLDTSTPENAREHARSQAGTIVESMPTIPVTSAVDIPRGATAASLLWDETLGAGAYCSRILPRGARLRLINLKGDACANVLLYNADHPTERLNVADTLKVQWNGYLGQGKLLLSDMGRVLMSIIDDTSGRHDALCGASNAKNNAAKYGAGENHTACPNARDRFILALAKHGLDRRDVMPGINIFKSVRIEPDGSTTFHPGEPNAGEYVELRAEMNVLAVIANTPHVLDPRATYIATPLRVTAWRGPIASANDPIRTATPENLRAFENVEDYFLNSLK
jgi:urea carboxylase-associated protein 2